MFVGVLQQIRDNTNTKNQLDDSGFSMTILKITTVIPILVFHGEGMGFVISAIITKNSLQNLN